MPTKTQEKKPQGPAQAKQEDELTHTKIKQTDTQTGRERLLDGKEKMQGEADRKQKYLPTKSQVQI